MAYSYIITTFSLRMLFVRWAAYQPTPNCQIYLIVFQLYYDAIGFKFYSEMFTHWGRLICCPMYRL